MYLDDVVEILIKLALSFLLALVGCLIVFAGYKLIMDGHMLYAIAFVVLFVFSYAFVDIYT